MSLEFTAIDPLVPDLIEFVAGIPLQAHERIMLIAHDQGLKLLSRMADYWKDTVYQSCELELLRRELSQVQNMLCTQDPETVRMTDLVAKMDAVIAKAQEINGYVEAIAD